MFVSQTRTTAVSLLPRVELMKSFQEYEDLHLRLLLNARISTICEQLMKRLTNVHELIQI